MTLTRRICSLLLTAAFLLGPAGPALAQDNAAVAVNTKDDSSVFKLAFDIRRTMQPVVESSNAAVAYAECADCRTVAVAIQIVLVMGDVTSATPENVAIAINNECTACETFAAAFQFVLSTGGRVRFSKEAQRELHAIKRLLKELGRSDIPLSELDAALQQIKERISSVLATGLEPVPEGERGGDDGAGPDDEGDVDAEETPGANGSPAPSGTTTPEPAGAAPAETPTPSATPTETSTPSPTPTATATLTPEGTP